MSGSLMNVREFADELGVTAACIRRWILERRVAVIKIGRLVKLQKSEVERLIQAGLRPAKMNNRKAGR